MSHLWSWCSEFGKSTSRKIVDESFRLLLAHFAPNLNFEKCLRRGNQMQGKFLVIYSKSNFFELEVTDLGHVWSIFRNFEKEISFFIWRPIKKTREKKPGLTFSDFCSFEKQHQTYQPHASQEGFDLRLEFWLANLSSYWKTHPNVNFTILGHETGRNTGKNSSKTKHLVGNNI